MLRASRDPAAAATVQPRVRAAAGRTRPGRRAPGRVGSSSCNAARAATTRRASFPPAALLQCASRSSPAVAPAAPLAPLPVWLPPLLDVQRGPVEQALAAGLGARLVEHTVPRVRLKAVRMSPLTSSAMWGYLPVASRRLTYSRLAAEPGLHPKLNGAVRDSLVLARRNLSHIRQIPEKLIDVTLQPLVFVILFAYVFGGVIAIPDGSYREYLVGGVLVQTLAFGIMGPSIATNLTEAALA